VGDLAINKDTLDGAVRGRKRWRATRQARVGPERTR
jgi:hypothetical protein